MMDKFLDGIAYTIMTPLLIIAYSIVFIIALPLLPFMIISWAYQRLERKHSS